MIENEHQYEISQRRLAELREWLEDLRRKYPEHKRFQVLSLGVRSHIAQIESEINAYLQQRNPAESVTS